MRYFFILLYISIVTTLIPQTKLTNRLIEYIEINENELIPNSLKSSLGNIHGVNHFVTYGSDNFITALA